jgi:hypothetical protein
MPGSCPGRMVFATRPLDRKRRSSSDIWREPSSGSDRGAGRISATTASQATGSGSSQTPISTPACRQRSALSGFPLRFCRERGRTSPPRISQGGRPDPEFMPNRKKSSKPRVSAKTVPHDLPLFCDYSCPHASFAAPSSVGACRREQGVYCTLFKAHNNKNSVCVGRK